MKIVKIGKRQEALERLKGI